MVRGALDHCFLLLSFITPRCHPFPSLLLPSHYNRMTHTISPLSIRQWQDNEKNSQDESLQSTKESENPSLQHPSSQFHEDNDEIAMKLEQAFDVSAAQTLLLQQVLPLYAKIAQTVSSSHSTLQANQLSRLLQELQRVADSLQIHLAQAIRNKIRLNGRKYPVEQAKVSVLNKFCY